MQYQVKARFRADTAGDFLRKLTDGTIAKQEPDGREIVAAMHRARVGDDGVTRWTEECYCPTPLAHERETVYDSHFTDLETEPINGGGAPLEGRPLLDFLQEQAHQ